MVANAFKVIYLAKCAATVVVVMFVSSAPAWAGSTAFKQAVAEFSSQDTGLAEFYRSQGFQPFWTADDASGLARRQALIKAFAQANLHGLPQRRFDPEVLIEVMGRAQGGRRLGEIEVALSRAYLDYAHAVQSGLLKPSSIDESMVRRVTRRDNVDLLNLILDGSPSDAFTRLPPQSPEYARLMHAKLRLEHAIARGGWGPSVEVRTLRPGDIGGNVIALRNRLIKMGYLLHRLVTAYDMRVKSAVEAFQRDHGLEQDGIAGSGTLAMLNVSPERRLEAVLVAMERERWINFEEGLGERHVWVNLTDFKARIIDDGKITFETRSVVGHKDTDRQTPEFSDVMEHMVINPSWYVPRSIVVGEYLPAMQLDPAAHDYLELTDDDGNVVERGFDFAEFTEETFPFGMRQPPGSGNALGSVKFMFPNRHNIYLHDTPQRHLFALEQRTFSHGCVRLNDPHDFAYALLALQTNNPQAYFQSILRTNEETQIDLVKDVPVHLVYRTAYVSPKGDMQFRQDIYDRDAKVWQALRAQGVVLTRADS
jgi:murein L,D-transpeptidase YcbB/YkuD